MELDLTIQTSPDRLTQFGWEEAFVAAAIWTFVRPLRSVKGASNTDDVRRVIGPSRPSCILPWTYPGVTESLNYHKALASLDTEPC